MGWFNHHLEQLSNQKVPCYLFWNNFNLITHKIFQPPWGSCISDVLMLNGLSLWVFHHGSTQGVWPKPLRWIGGRSWNWGKVCCATSRWRNIWEIWQNLVVNVVRCGELIRTEVLHRQQQQQHHHVLLIYDGLEWLEWNEILGGGFKHFLLSPLLGVATGSFCLGGSPNGPKIAQWSRHVFRQVSARKWPSRRIWPS